ncbi:MULTISPECIES: hypothetical protein [unclassified Streptomyces]|uniref:hypothetical protein n=1 Tax=unclassified Streptomyces TaxID=2593676 RepID=UPI001660FB35|nr:MULTISPECIES: hypothetical protein [unclassified Streptomyces]
MTPVRLPGLLSAGRVDEIRAGQYHYRTTEQLDRDIRDLLAERDRLLADIAERGKDTAPVGESTPAPYHAPQGEVRFAVYGSVQLLAPAVRDLEPDFYGHRYRQLGGWLPDIWTGELPRGTECLEWAHVPGLVMPTEINVQVATSLTRDGSRYMTVEWRRERP